MQNRGMIRKLSLILVLALASCGPKLASKQDVSIAGMVPRLTLSMQDATGGQAITAADLRGKVTLLYFGYTNCPDVCPNTLYNVDQILKLLGPAAQQVQFLFVTVDPDRDNLAVLKQYTALFGPEFIGLRGTPNQLAQLARRYRVVFSVTHHPYTVTHSAGIFVFDPQGKPQFVISGLDGLKPDLTGIAQDIGHLVKTDGPT
jgi:protein SCO1/2